MKRRYQLKRVIFFYLHIFRYKLKISDEIIESLFPNAKIILSFHYRILDKLNKWTPKNDTLLEIFSEIEEWYDVYLQYWSNHSSAYFKLTKNLLKKNKNFSKLYCKLCKDFNWVNFDSFMISPIQRIPRYMLYLKDLLKHTYEGNKVYMNYQMCLK